MQKPEKTVDLIVLGCGPAGYAAAYTAHKAGLAVVVISKLKRWGHDDGLPTPAQSIHPGVVSLLNQLGLKHLSEQASRATFSEIKSGNQVNQLGHDGETWYGHHIDREVFDQGLMENLQALKIELRNDSILEVHGGTDGVRVDTPKHKYRARYVIDATGFRRKSSQSLQLYNQTYSAIMTCWTGRSVLNNTSDQALKTSFQALADGWVWIAPESDNTYTWTQLSLSKSKPTQGPLSGSILIGKPDGHNVSWRLSRPICKDHIILCGDAAGMIDPASGQGILKALLSGIQASHCVQACLSQPTLATKHQVEYDQWFTLQFEQSVAQLTRHYRTLGINHKAMVTAKDQSTFY